MSVTAEGRKQNLQRRGVGDGGGQGGKWGVEGGGAEGGEEGCT